MDPQGIYGKTRELLWSPIPLQPLAVVFTDRDDGTEWLLSFNAAEEQLTLTTDIGNFPNITRVGRYGGPYLFRANSYVRLFVRGGHLGWEEGPSIISHPVYARRGTLRRWKQMILPTTWNTAQRLAWEDGF